MCQAGFANTRRAHDQDGATAARRSLLKGGFQRLQFRFTTNQRTETSRGSSLPLSTYGYPHQFETINRTRYTSYRRRTSRSYLYEILGELIGRFSEQHAS